MAEPMYRQIAEILRGRIESGEIAPGAQLPTEIELMDQYMASRNTVRDAIKLLTTRGLVEARAGQGTFVVEKINPFVTTLTGELGANVNESQVFEIFRVGYSQDGERFRLTTTVYPADRNRFLIKVGEVPPRDVAAE